MQGLYHTQVLQLLLGGAEHVSLRATPLDQTSIKTGGRKREPGQSKLAKRSLNRQKKQKRESDKRRKTSLFRRISSKRASVEMQQVGYILCRGSHQKNSLGMVNLILFKLGFASYFGVNVKFIISLI